MRQKTVWVPMGLIVGAWLSVGCSNGSFQFHERAPVSELSPLEESEAPVMVEAEKQNESPNVNESVDAPMDTPMSLPDGTPMKCPEGPLSREALDSDAWISCPQSDSEAKTPTQNSGP